MKNAGISSKMGIYRHKLTYKILVKIYLLFIYKKRRNRAEARSQTVEKNPAQRFFDSLQCLRGNLGGLFLSVYTVLVPSLISLMS